MSTKYICINCNTEWDEHPIICTTCNKNTKIIKVRLNEKEEYQEYLSSVLDPRDQYEKDINNNRHIVVPINNKRVHDNIMDLQILGA